MSSKPRLLLAFALAVLLASLLASIFQTQTNLAALQALGAPVPLDVRVATTCLDLLGFAPIFTLLCALGFVVALPLANWCARRMPTLRWMIFVVAGAMAIWSVLALANAAAPMPTLIAADRSAVGTLGLMACGSVGALLFGLLGRRVRYRMQPTSSDSL
jgi:peptidoglycan/LPS O-acetylase OafA/YrhL